METKVHDCCGAGATEMNKLDASEENPIDRLLYAATARLLPLLCVTGHHPNLLTTYSLILALGSLAALHRGALEVFTLLHAAAYAFDCADGQFARRYRMTSTLGDWYDHVADQVKLFLLYAVVWRRYRLRLADVAPYAAACIWQKVYTGCQERAYHDKSSGGGEANPRQNESLTALRVYCPDRDYIRSARFFGHGTVHLLLLLTVWYLELSGRQRGAPSRNTKG